MRLGVLERLQHSCCCVAGCGVPPEPSVSTFSTRGSPSQKASTQM